MKKRIIFYTIFFLLLFVGCSAFKRKYDNTKFFKPYIDEFVELSKGKVTSNDIEGLTIGFDDPIVRKTRAVGICYIVMKHINIDKTYWDNHEEIEKKALIFHEMGHCVCYQLRHRNKVIKYGCPSSIMNSRTIPDVCLIFFWNYYIKELFDNC